jgi:hypothetical protein
MKSLETSFSIAHVLPWYLGHHNCQANKFCFPRLPCLNARISMLGWVATESRRELGLVFKPGKICCAETTSTPALSREAVATNPSSSCTAIAAWNTVDMKILMIQILLVFGLTILNGYIELMIKHMNFFKILEE